VIFFAGLTRAYRFRRRRLRPLVLHSRPGSVDEIQLLQLQFKPCLPKCQKIRRIAFSLAEWYTLRHALVRAVRYSPGQFQG
jgi:hypothetical protein